jgi:ATP-binding cassette subfamily F protein 3
MNELEFTGKLKLGHNVKIGYFAQNQASLLDENLTVFDTVDYVATGEIRTKIRDILGAFMFGGEDSEKKVKVLSGGERSRLAMIRLLLEPVNLLILDEPTNHLDIRSKDILKEAIRKFDGTVILVSHDRDFLNNLVDKVYEFSNKGIHEHLGGIQEFLERKKIENLQELELGKTVEKKSLKLLTENSASSDNKLNYEARKEYNKKLRKAEKKVEKAEDEIAEMEAEISEMNKQMEIAEKSSDPDFLMLFQRKQREMEHKMYEWELLIEKLERIKC